MLRKFTKIKKNVVSTELFAFMENELKAFKQRKIKRSFNEYGVVLAIQDGVAIVTGLRKVGLTETVKFRSGITGMVSTLERDLTRICLMGPDHAVKPGDTVYRLRKFIEVPTGMSLLGRVVDSLGNPIDGKGALEINVNTKQKKRLQQRLPKKKKLK